MASSSSSSSSSTPSSPSLLSIAEKPARITIDGYIENTSPVTGARGAFETLRMIPESIKDFYPVFIKKTEKILDQNIPESIISNELREYKKFFDDLDYFGKMLVGADPTHFWVNSTTGFDQMKALIDSKIDVLVKNSESEVSIESVSLSTAHMNSISRMLNTLYRKTMLNGILEHLKQWYLANTTAAPGIDTTGDIIKYDSRQFSDEYVYITDGAVTSLLRYVQLNILSLIIHALEDPTDKTIQAHLSPKLFKMDRLVFFNTPSSTYTLDNIIMTIFTNILDHIRYSNSRDPNISSAFNLTFLVDRFFAEIPHFLKMFVQTTTVLPMQYQEFLEELSKSEQSIISSLLNKSTLENEDAIMNQFVHQKYISMIGFARGWVEGIPLSTLIDSNESAIRNAFANVCKYNTLYEHSVTTSAVATTSKATGNLMAFIFHLKDLLSKKGLMSESTSSSSSSSYSSYGDSSKRQRVVQFRNAVQLMGD